MTIQPLAVADFETCVRDLKKWYIQSWFKMLCLLDVYIGACLIIMFSKSSWYSITTWFWNGASGSQQTSPQADLYTTNPQKAFLWDAGDSHRSRQEFLTFQQPAEICNTRKLQVYIYIYIIYMYNIHIYIHIIYIYIHLLWITLTPNYGILIK